MLKAGALIVLAALAAARSIPPSQPHQQAVWVKTNQQSDSATRGNQEDSESSQHPSKAAPPVGVAPGPNGKHQTYATRDEGTEYWPPFYGYRVKITDSLLALFTLGLVIIGYITAGILRSTDKSTAKNAEAALEAAKAANTNTDIMRIQMRAALSAYPNGIQFNDGWKFRIVVEVDNSGQTPAYECRLFWVARMLPHPIAGEIRLDPEEVIRTPPTVIRPGVPRETSQTFEFTPEHQTQMHEGTHALYVSGFISFVDAFEEGKNRRSTCFWTKTSITAGGNWRVPPPAYQFMPSGKSRISATVLARQSGRSDARAVTTISVENRRPMPKTDAINPTFAP